jgi:hypothetical protein
VAPDVGSISVLKLLLVIVGAVLDVADQVSAQTPHHPAPAPLQGPASGDDPLVELNQAFRAAYAQQRAETLTAAGPVIIVAGDDLVLINGGRRVQVPTGRACESSSKGATRCGRAIWRCSTSIGY